MDTGLTERDWKRLLTRIREGKCTPFIGPAVSQQYLQLLQTITAQWRNEFGYPLDRDNLASVAQYLSFAEYPGFPKEEIQERFAEIETADFLAANQPHAILAALPFPIYVTSNYDNLLIDALKRNNKVPRRELLRWNPALRRSYSSDLREDFVPTPVTPLVYHLHGYTDLPDSLVLTEDDYLDFLANISFNDYEPIRLALSASSLLVVGYQPGHWEFRALFRGFVTRVEADRRGISVTVQVSPDTIENSRTKVQDYLSKYVNYTDREMRIYWGTAEEFISELHQRWQGESVMRDQAQPAEDEGLGKLRDNMADAFNLQELYDLTQFSLGVDYETFPKTKPDYIRELIRYMKRHGRLAELIDQCQQKRPHINWV